MIRSSTWSRDKEISNIYNNIYVYRIPLRVRERTSLPEIGGLFFCLGMAQREITGEGCSSGTPPQ